MRLLLSVSAAALMTAGAASAQSVVALTGDNTLVMIDPANATATGSLDVAVEGRLLGIDWRPNTQQLIGVTEDWRVVSIDWTSGETTDIVTMDTPLEIADGAAVIVDINPAADALRFMSGTVNHRVNLGTGAVMVDGALHFAADGEHASETPMVGGTAYTNSVGRPEATAMYNIDTAMSALLRQNPPNDGTNMAVGMLGAEIEGPIAFDIYAAAVDDNAAWLIANGGLHSVDLETGAVTGSWELQGVDGEVRDMTVVPPM
ncbi:DUF4394 domain-containing protein [Pararhodobacter sp.]|uniref:DUF4394 domain-containing protein n=1 Tax=Pararhodobacter sp. TaxID=2127056 RepID=UPI002FE34933|nr:DUF4394 domain-containing protein [Pseudomonadota bacterium]